jgi:hypothetical protein
VPALGRRGALLRALSVGKKKARTLTNLVVEHGGRGGAARGPALTG